MGKAAIRLPEKSYFFLAEIAERWGCSVDHVLHFVNEGRMRPAILGSRLRNLDLFDIDELVQTENSQGRKFSLRQWLDGFHPISQDVKDSIKDHAFRDIDNSFFYIVPEFIRLCEQGVGAPVVESFEGARYGLLNCFGDYSPTPFNVSEMVMWCEEDPFMLLEYHVEWSPIGIIIPREERDRFEQENRIFESSAQTPPSYSTPYLEVMHEAIAEFFEPRRSRDPKKDEVVSWINERLVERGLGKSGNAASTMFTIIKPTDHNPRKEKG